MGTEADLERLRHESPPAGTTALELLELLVGRRIVGYRTDLAGHYGLEIEGGIVLRLGGEGTWAVRP